jgi:hypothetical protein
MDRRANFGRAGSVLLLALLSGDPTLAALPDPTRPPPGMVTGQPQAGSAGMVFGITSPAPVPVPPPAATPRAAVLRAPAPVPRVQALRHHATDSTSASASALIDGRLFRVGDRLGDATVQAIQADGVWLRPARGTPQWLGLYAPVEPTTTTTTTAITSAPDSATGANPVRKEP